jgi:bifunctional non-homologous end joining protein LigD
MTRSSGPTLEIGGRTVTLSNTGKVFFPDDGITKGDLIAYYGGIADVMVPHLRGRPLSLQRFPDGIAGSTFFQKKIGDYFPDWIERVEVPKKGGTVTHVVCEDPATLVYLANQAVIVIHVWLSRADRIRQPDRIVFDFDPPDASPESFALVREKAQECRVLLEALGLVPFVMSTGSRGLHVTVPIQRRHEVGEVHEFAAAVAEWQVRRDPDRVTTEFHKARRGGRLFLDFMRNAYAQTAVAPYSVRARPGAPVATPLAWDDLADPALRSDAFTIRNLGRRLSQQGDPWRDIGRAARSLGAARRRLDRLIRSSRLPQRIAIEM